MGTAVKLSDDEVVVKDYYAANIKKPTKGEAHVILTNKRVMINYQTEKSILINDLHIKEVRGADVSWSTANMKKEGIVLVIVGIILSILSMTSWPSTVFLLAIGATTIGFGIYFIIKTKTTFIMLIHSKSITESLAIHNLSSNFLTQKVQSSGLNLKISATPGPDAHQMASEIGVIILDIQKKAKHETEIL